MRSGAFVSIVVATYFLLACSDDSRSPAPVTDGSPADGQSLPKSVPTGLDFAAFDSAIESFLSVNQLAGASAVIVHNDYGIVHERGYGSFSADRLYLIASSSKILSVGIMMSLVDSGALNIDSPISQYLGAWGNFKENITAAQLVSNSSGLISLTDNPTYAKYLCQYSHVGTLADCAKAIYAADDEADRIEPDTAFHYGGGQWQLAGGIAEAVSGKKWATLVSETYVTPCDTPSLGFTNQFTRAAGERSAAGDAGSQTGTGYPQFFKADLANLPATENPSIEGGAYVTAHDYGKILLMHLRGGLCDNNRVLKEESVARMQNDRIAEAYNGSTTSSSLAGYGMGWWIDREHPGVVVDGGAYGAIPWLDNPRHYGALVLLEASAALGGKLYAVVKPAADAAFDAIL
jgi:CubicO group peptidase (beta-lactamase class C family)